jgi:hypothetical protein
MTRRVMVFVLVSIAVIAIIAMVSFGLSHAQTMMENASFMGVIGGHMSQHDHGSCGEDMSTHMNATGNMPGNMLDECGDVHDGMDTAGHMMGMH